jgi:hypothetical protein
VPYDKILKDPVHQKITFGEVRASGVRGILIYCADYRCPHPIAISGNGALSTSRDPRRCPR